MIRRVRVWDAEGKCAKGHVHFARTQDGAKAARGIVREAIKKCEKAA
jgi:hypothetical protein